MKTASPSTTSRSSALRSASETRTVYSLPQCQCFVWAVHPCPSLALPSLHRTLFWFPFLFCVQVPLSLRCHIYICAYILLVFSWRSRNRSPASVSTYDRPKTTKPIFMKFGTEIRNVYQRVSVFVEIGQQHGTPVQEDTLLHTCAHCHTHLSRPRALRVTHSFAKSRDHAVVMLFYWSSGMASAAGRCVGLQLRGSDT